MKSELARRLLRAAFPLMASGLAAGTAQAATRDGNAARGTPPADHGSSVLVEGTVINHAEGPGAVSEQSFGGDTSVARGTTIVTHNGTTRVYGGGEAKKDPLDHVNEDLRKADFAGRALRGAAFTNADLDGADLRRADLRDADFVNANLRGARLDGADLRGADLTNAELDGAHLDGATWTDGRTCANGARGGCG